jgi:hypothetical protein
MKSLAAVALATTLLGLALPAIAQDSAPAAPRWQQSGPRHFAPDRGMPNRFGPGRLLMLACSDKGPEALELALVRMSYRLELTTDQQKLFDAFRSKALTTETSFADACKANRPATADNARPDLLARMKAGLAIDQARLTALSDVLPDFETFFNSLSDEQKANVLPGRGMGMGTGRWHRQGGTPPNTDHNGPAPAAPQNS